MFLVNLKTKKIGGIIQPPNYQGDIEKGRKKRCARASVNPLRPTLSIEIIMLQGSAFPKIKTQKNTKSQPLIVRPKFLSQKGSPKTPMNRKRKGIVLVKSMA